MGRKVAYLAPQLQLLLPQPWALTGTLVVCSMQHRQSEPIQCGSASEQTDGEHRDWYLKVEVDVEVDAGECCHWRDPMVARVR
jgi:hypothetical protein